MYTILNPNFNISILSTKAQSGRTLGILMAENIERDELMSSIRKQEEMKINVLDADMGIKEEEREVYTNLRL